MLDGLLRDAEVYAPAEDTELLLQALDALPIGPGTRACDVGTGTGAAALALARRGADVIALDVNPRACALAKTNAARAGLAARVHVLRGSLLDAVRRPFDVVAFNPPYLPVEGESASPLARAWEGGQGGVAWAPGFLDGLGRVLAPGGSAVVVLSSLGHPDRFGALAAERGFVGTTVAEAKLPWELLKAVRVQRGNL